MNEFNDDYDHWVEKYADDGRFESFEEYLKYYNCELINGKIQRKKTPVQVKQDVSESLLSKITNSVPYILFVVFIILPMDIYFIRTGREILGIILILMQVPWGINIFLKYKNRR